MGYLSNDDIHCAALGLAQCVRNLQSALKWFSSWCNQKLHQSLYLQKDEIDNAYPFAYAPYHDYNNDYNNDYNHDHE